MQGLRSQRPDDYLTLRKFAMPVRASDAGLHTPMGATPTPEGTTLRCWAPSAQSAYVLTSPTDQPKAENQLISLGDGTWAALDPDLREGASYLFWINGPEPKVAFGSGRKRDPYARELTLDPAFPSSFCVVRDPGTYPWHDAGWHPPAFADLIIYQLHVGTWHIAASRSTRGGSFLDVATNLPYLAALGITAIQLLPVQEFETEFSLGYNGVDYFSPEGEYQVPPNAIGSYLDQINALLGTFGKPPLTTAQLAPAVNQLKCLIDLAHLHGIAVIFDIVYNHAGGDFDAQSLFFFDCRPRGNNNDSLYFTDQGWANGLIFAYWNQNVRQFLIDNAGFFLREYRIDGFRYDEVRVISDHGGRQFCQDLTGTVRYVNPAAIQIAEYWDPDRPNAVRPPPDGLGFDAELGDGLRDALRDLIRQASGGETAALDLDRVAGALAPILADPWRMVQFVENQDETYVGHDGAARIAALADAADPSAWYGRSRARVALAILLVAAGIPSLFMGQETLEPRLWSDDPSRPDTLINWQALSTDPARRDYLRFATDMIAQRRRLPALRGPGIRVSRANSFERVLVIHRWLEGEGADVVLVASLDERAKFAYRVGLPAAGPWRECLNSDVYDAFPNPHPVGNDGSVNAEPTPWDGFAASAALNIPANGALVLARG